MKKKFIKFIKLLKSFFGIENEKKNYYINKFIKFVLIKKISESNL